MKNLLFSFVAVLICLAVALPVFTGTAWAYEIGEVIEKNCSRCGGVTPHTILDYVAPTCTLSGAYKAQCQLCNGPARLTKINALLHDWKTVYESATCTEDGFASTICDRCGEVDGSVVYPATGHKMSDPYVVGPFCEEDGYSRSYCLNSVGDGACDYVELETIPALGGSHIFELIISREPTCTDSGAGIRDCSRCSLRRSETLPALDHDWKEFSRTGPTCTDPGSVTYQCSRCDFAKSEPIPALGTDHTWEETSHTEPTATAPGSVEYTCAICGTSKTESIPSLGPDGSDLTTASLLAKMTDVFSVVLSWVGVVSQAVAASPILLLCVVVGFIGTGVLLFKRLLNI